MLINIGGENMGDKFDEIIKDLINDNQPTLRYPENSNNYEGLRNLNEGLLTTNFTLNNEGLSFEISSKHDSKK